MLSGQSPPPLPKLRHLLCSYTAVYRLKRLCSPSTADKNPGNNQHFTANGRYMYGGLIFQTIVVLREPRFILG